MRVRGIGLQNYAPNGNDNVKPPKDEDGTEIERLIHNDSHDFEKKIAGLVFP